MWRQSAYDSALLRHFHRRLVEALLSERERADAAERTIGELVHERWPAGGRS